MNNQYKYLMKNTGILTLSNFSSKILVFLLVPLYTSTLTTSEYGIYDLVLSTIQLLFPLLTLNIADGVMRFSMEKSHEKNEIISIATIYVAGGILGGSLLLVVNRLFGIWKDIEGMEILILLYYIFYMLNQLLLQFAKGQERIKDLGIAGIVGTVSMLLFNLFFLCVTKSGLKGFFAANILGQAIPTIYYFFRLRIWEYIGASFNRQLHMELIAYSFPLLFSTLGWWINNTADKYVVFFLCGAAANGLLSIAYKIPSILNTFQSIFIQAWQVSAIREYGTAEAKIFYKSAFLYSNACMCVMCSGLIAMSKIIAKILFANEFYSAWVYVPFLLVSSAVNAASGFLGPILSAEKKSKEMAKSAVYGVLANIILNLCLVIGIGVQGAALATAISSLVIFYVRKKAVGTILSAGDYRLIYCAWSVLFIESALEIWLLCSFTTWFCVLVILILYRKVIFYGLKIIRGRFKKI